MVRKRRKTETRIQVQSLEVRDMKSAVSVEFEHGTLKIEGTPDDDSIDISQEYRGSYSDSYIRIVTGPGETPIIHAANGLDRIVANLGDGDDRFVNNTTIPDIIHAGAGNDLVLAGAADSVVHGGPGADEIKGRAGNDQLDGEDGPDKLFGQEDDDRLLGGRGKDSLIGGAGSDFLDGGYHGELFVSDELHGEGIGISTASAGGDTFVIHRRIDHFFSGGRFLGGSRRIQASSDPVDMNYGGTMDTLHFMDHHREHKKLTFGKPELKTPLFPKW